MRSRTLPILLAAALAVVGVSLLCTSSLAGPVPVAAAPTAPLATGIPEWIAIHFGTALDWLLKAAGAAVLWIVGRYLTRNAIVQRALLEVGGAVREVYETWTKVIKEARTDGILTPAEATEARKRAWDVFKANLGEKGLARLGRVLGVDVEAWFGTHREGALASIKAAPPAPAAVGAAASPFPLPSNRGGL